MHGTAKSVCVESPDTEDFRHEYMERFNKKMIIDSIVKKKNKAILMEFPWLFIEKAGNKLKYKFLKSKK